MTENKYEVQYMLRSTTHKAVYVFRNSPYLIKYEEIVRKTSEGCGLGALRGGTSETCQLVSRGGSGRRDVEHADSFNVGARKF